MGGLTGSAWLWPLATWFTAAASSAGSCPRGFLGNSSSLPGGRAERKSSTGPAEKVNSDEETLIHIHDESQQDMESCNITGREGHGETEQLQKGKEMEKHWKYCLIFQTAAGLSQDGSSVKF